MSFLRIIAFFILAYLAVRAIRNILTPSQKQDDVQVHGQNKSQPIQVDEDEIQDVNYTESDDLFDDDKDN